MLVDMLWHQPILSYLNAIFTFLWWLQKKRQWLLHVLAYIHNINLDILPAMSLHININPNHINTSFLSNNTTFCILFNSKINYNKDFKLYLSPVFEKDLIAHATVICQKMSELSYTSGSDKSWQTPKGCLFRIISANRIPWVWKFGLKMSQKQSRLLRIQVLHSTS